MPIFVTGQNRTAQVDRFPVGQRRTARFVGVGEPQTQHGFEIIDRRSHFAEFHLFLEPGYASNRRRCAAPLVVSELNRSELNVVDTRKGKKHDPAGDERNGRAEKKPPQNSPPDDKSGFGRPSSRKERTGPQKRPAN